MGTIWNRAEQAAEEATGLRSEELTALYDAWWGTGGPLPSYGVKQRFFLALAGDRGFQGRVLLWWLRQSRPLEVIS